MHILTIKRFWTWFALVDWPHVRIWALVSNLNEYEIEKLLKHCKDKPKQTKWSVVGLWFYERNMKIMNAVCHDNAQCIKKMEGCFNMYNTDVNAAYLFSSDHF